MKIALIPPVPMLRWTYKTKYQLMLPQLCDYDNYRTVYRGHCDDPHTYVILDNGAAEGIDTSSHQLMSVASVYKPNEIVIPDSMGNAQETVDKAQAFHDDVVPPRSIGPLKFRLMFVVQGQTMQEVLSTGIWALNEDWIDTIGIPRHMIDTLEDPLARTRIANILSDYQKAKPIHFLGANTSNPLEVKALTDPFRTKQDYIRGMDTSMPFSYAIYDRKLDEQDQDGSARVSRPPNYFERKPIEFDENVLTHNINLLLQYEEAN